MPLPRLVPVLCLSLLIGCGGEDFDDLSGESQTGGAAGFAAGGGVGGGSGGWATGGAGGGVGGAAGEPGSGGTAGAAGEPNSAGAGGEPSSGGTGGTQSDCPRVKVQVPAGEVLNVRPSPDTSQAPVGTLPNGAIVDVLAIVQGQNIDGNATWFTGQGLTGYVSGAFAVCTQEEPPPPPKGYYLPLQCGTKAMVTQGPNGGVSHQGSLYWAYDFGLPLNTPVVAMADGTVTHASIGSKPGDPCYNGGGSSCGPYANRVTIKHGDGFSTYYSHLNTLNVSAGQVVKRGDVIGLSGSTGWSTGPHLHAQKQESCGAASCNSLKLTFVDAGEPAVGTTVTSGNCP